jgi:hypothetical protein
VAAPAREERKRNEMLCHHKLEAYLDAYIEAAGLFKDRKGPLFRSAIGKTGQLSGRSMLRGDVWRMVRLAADAGIETAIGCHTFRAYAGCRTMPGKGSMERRNARHQGGSAHACTLPPGIVLSLDQSVLRNASSSSSAR